MRENAGDLSGNFYCEGCSQEGKKFGFLCGRTSREMSGKVAEIEFFEI